MDRSEVIQRVREYNKTLSGIWCTSLEKQYIKQVEESSYFYGFFITELEVPESAAEFFEQQRKFNGLLKENKGKLCDYCLLYTSDAADE